MKDEEIDYFLEKIEEKENTSQKNESDFQDEFNKDYNLFSKDDNFIEHVKKKSELQFINQSDISLNNNEKNSPRKKINKIEKQMIYEDIATPINNNQYNIYTPQINTQIPGNNQNVFFPNNMTTPLVKDFKKNIFNFGDLLNKEISIKDMITGNPMKNTSYKDLNETELYNDDEKLEETSLMDSNLISENVSHNQSRSKF